MKNLVIVLLVIAWACTSCKDDHLKYKIEYLQKENSVLRERLFEAGIWERT